ncbi:MAG: hypothetical protein HUJ29_00575 [Gammaproteobacteria bacterium]|nr:hypothetical protein [Gammaproteobacteria bacterium]
MMYKVVPTKHPIRLVYGILIFILGLYWLNSDGEYIFLYGLTFVISFVTALGISDLTLYLFKKVRPNVYTAFSFVVSTSYILATAYINNSDMFGVFLIYYKLGVYISIGVIGNFLFMEKVEKQNNLTISSKEGRR